MRSLPFSRSRALSTTSRRVLHLSRLRHQRGAVLIGPAVILRVRHLQPVRAERFGERDHLLDVIEVLAMHDGVDGERQAALGDELRRLELLLEGLSVVGDAVAAFAGRVLHRDLHVLDARLDERIRLLRREADRRGDEIDVEPGRARAAHDVGDIGPHQRLAAGDVELHDAERRRLVEDARPFRRRQLALRPLQRDGVGAVGALQRAAMRDLGEQPERNFDLRRRLDVGRGRAAQRSRLRAQASRRRT